MIAQAILLVIATQSPADAAAGEGAAPPPSPRAVAVPEILRPLVDSAGVLPEDVDADLSRKLHAHRDTSGVAVGVLLVESLAKLGATLPDASTAASHAFSSGWAKGSPWILVFLSVNDRKLRIEGDSRLKESFTDDDALRLTTEATGRFAAGDLAGGLKLLVEGIIAETPEAPASGEERVLAFLVAGGTALAFVGLVAWLRRRKPPTTT